MLSKAKSKIGYEFDQLSENSKDTAVNNFVNNFMSELDGLTLQLYLRREKDFHEPHEYNYELLKAWVRKLIYERNGKFVSNGDIIYMETSPRIYTNFDLTKENIETVYFYTARMSDKNIKFLQEVIDKKNKFPLSQNILDALDTRNGKCEVEA